MHHQVFVKKGQTFFDGLTPDIQLFTGIVELLEILPSPPVLRRTTWVLFSSTRSRSVSRWKSS